MSATSITLPADKVRRVLDAIKNLEDLQFNLRHTSEQRAEAVAHVIAAGWRLGFEVEDAQRVEVPA